MSFKILLFITLMLCLVKVFGFTMETEKLDNFYREYGKWAIKYRSVNVIFCQVEPSNAIIKFLMIQGLAVKLVTYAEKAKNHNVNLKNDYIHNLNFLVITSIGVDESPKACITSSIPIQLLKYVTKLVIYNSSGENSTFVDDIGEPLKFLGSANVLYRSGGLCWLCSAPFMLRRSFNRPELCSDSLWPTPVKTPLNLLGQTIEVVSFHHPLSSIIHFNESDPIKRYDGIEMNIFFEVAKILNINWTLNELHDEYDKWGQFINGSWKGGIVEALMTGTAEIGFCTLWMSPFHIPFLEFTYSWTTVELVFLVPKPSRAAVSWRSMFKPFSITVWALTSLTFLIFLIVAWTTTNIYHLLYPSRAGSWSLLSYILYTLGLLTGGSGHLTKWLPLGQLSFSWSVFTLLLTNTYTSNIVADLSLPAHTPSLDTVQQLVDQNFSWGLSHPEYTMGKILNLQKYSHREFAKKFIVYNSTDQRKLLLQKKFALIAQRLEGTDFIILDTVVDDDVAEFLKIMKEQILYYRTSIVLRKNSPLLASFNSALQRLIQSGLVQYYKRDTELRYKNLSNVKIGQNVNNDHFPAAPITMKNYKIIFITLFFGWIVSSITFFLETKGTQVLSKIYK